MSLVSEQPGLRSCPPLTKTRALRPKLTLAAAILASAPLANAAPQASLGTTVGGAVTDLRAPQGPSGAFLLGGRGDVMFLRSRESDMGIGPYVDLTTESFDTLELGGGIEWLLPIVPSVPFVIGAGAFERRAPMFGWEPGLAASVFFGPRGYNFHSWYGMANGLFVEGRYGLGDGKQGDVLFGVRLDVVLLALPWLLGYQALAH